jgi:hypothetical protein
VPKLGENHLPKFASFCKDEARPLSYRQGWMASPKQPLILNAPTSRKNKQKAHPQFAAFWQNVGLRPHQSRAMLPTFLCETEHRLLRSGGMSTGGRETNVRQHNG